MLVDGEIKMVDETEFEIMYADERACRAHGYGCDCEAPMLEEKQDAHDAISQADEDNIYNSFLFCYEDEIARYCKTLHKKIEYLEAENQKLSKQVSDYGWEASIRNGGIQGMY